MLYLGLLIYCVLLIVRPGDWVGAVKGWPLEFAVLGTTVAGSAAWGISRRVTSEAREGALQFKFLALWLLAILMSNLTSGHYASGFEFTVAYAKKALILVAVWLVVRTHARMRGVAFVFTILAGLLGLQGIYQKEHGIGWAGQPLYWDNRISWVGLWDGANVLSLVFITAFPFVLEIVLGRWNLAAKLAALVSGGLILNGLRLAASRGAWLSLAVILLVYFKGKIGKLGLVLGALLFAALLMFGPDRFSRSDQRDTSSSAGRISMWAEGLEMVRDNPVFGIGKGRFGAYTHTLIAHNAFVQNMGETGFLGLFAWVGLVYIAARSARRALAAAGDVDPKVTSLNHAVLVGLAGYMTASMFISTDFDLLYFVLGLCTSTLTVARHESGQPLELDFGSRDLLRIALFAAGGIAAIYLVTMLMSAK